MTVTSRSSAALKTLASVPPLGLFMHPLVMFALPLRIRPLEVFYAVFFEVPQSGGNFVDQVVVASDSCLDHVKW